MTSIIIFPFGITVLIFYSCGHKRTGTDNIYILRVGERRWKEERKKGGQKGGGERERDRKVIKVKQHEVTEK